MATQAQIAGALGLDTSTVNKILTGRSGEPGIKFRQSTVERVKRTAKRLGYRRKPSKVDLRNAIRTALRTAQADGPALIHEEDVRRLRRLIG